MRKQVYTEYVRYMLQFYFQNPDKTSFLNDRDRINWKTCDKVIKRVSHNDRTVFKFVYGEFDTIADNVYVLSKINAINQNVIWNMLHKLEKEVAIERGMWV